MTAEILAMRIQQFFVGGAVTFATWLILGIVAALLNVPNFDAKRVGQECACSITPVVGSLGLDLHVEVAGLLISIWTLLPTVALAALAAGSVIRKPSWIMDRRNYFKGLRRAAFLGVFVGLLAAAVIVAEASLTNSFIVYPTQGQEEPLTPVGNRDFDMTLENGTLVKLSDFKGRPTLLEFMWTKCSHCQKETQDLSYVHRMIGEKVNVLSVSVTWGKDTIDSMKQFGKTYGVTWTSALDAGRGTDLFDATSVPKIFILDSEQNIIYTHEGEVSADTLISELSGLQ